ncbi:hypothetical protein AMECASPLE_029766 [Ameca splendens]|uniref:Uncharacterized protein n=1 Tax=Ameca splendens TaxID=208324 RepID=A0ABV0YHC0_9TELE
MEANKPFVEKETSGDCVERELGELPENESYTKQTVICAQKKVTEKELISETKEKVNQQEKKQPFKRKRKNKRTVAWETFLEPDNMQLENVTEISDIQTSESVQVENLTEVSDIQTSDSTQEESFTQASDHQSSEDAENNPRIRHIRRGWTRTYNCPTHHQNNRQRFCNQ